MVKLHKLNTQAISHPIHRLPLELLEHIFHLLLEIESKAKPYFSSWHDAFPLNLTQVCSQWESLVSLARNRRLWSMVWIDPADPDWLERLHLHLFLSREEGLDIHIIEITQSIVDALTGHHRRIRSLSGPTISQIWDPTTSERDIIQVVLAPQRFSIPLSSSVTALPFVALGKGSLHHLQSFSQLQVLEILAQMPQLLELSGPLQLPALQRLRLQTSTNPLDFLRVFTPSQLLDLHLWPLGSLSSAAYHELETFIIGHMPNLRWVFLVVYDYAESAYVQPVEESTTQSLSGRQSESLRRIECIMSSPSKDKTPPFERLIESAPYLEECYLDTSMKLLPCFSHHIRKLEFNFHNSHILPVVNGGLVKLAHLEVLKITFANAEQVQLLTLFQAPSLLSLEVTSKYGEDSQSHSIPVDAILTFISTSQGIHNMRLDLGSPIGGMGLSLLELRNLEISYKSHIFVLASFDVPKLQHLLLKTDDGCSGDEPIAGGEDLAGDPIGIASPPPAFEAVGNSNVLEMVNTRQILEIGNEQQKRNIPEEDNNGAKTNRFKDIDIREAPSDPVVARALPFPAPTFEHLKDFEFWVSSASDSHPIKAPPYFPGIFDAIPALERVTLPPVSFNNPPYIDQLVAKISENPMLCPNLQEIRTCDYPNDWSNLLRFLRDRKRAPILSNTASRPIHALHFPITPHNSIVEQLRDAMLGKVSIKPFPALYPWPLLDSTFVRIASSQGEDSQVDSDEETRSQAQDRDEHTAATHCQAQEEDITGNSDNERQNEEESWYGESEDEALSCFFCHKAGLGADCCRVYGKRRFLSKTEVSIGDVQCSRWDTDVPFGTTFEVICIP